MPDGALEPIETNYIEQQIQKCHARCTSSMWVGIPAADVVVTIIEHFGDSGSAFSISLHTQEGDPLIAFPPDFFTALENIDQLLNMVDAALVVDKHQGTEWTEHFHDEAHQVMWAIGFFDE